MAAINEPELIVPDRAIWPHWMLRWEEGPGPEVTFLLQPGMRWLHLLLAVGIALLAAGMLVVVIAQHGSAAAVAAAGILLAFALTFCPMSLVLSWRASVAIAAAAPPTTVRRAAGEIQVRSGTDQIAAPGASCRLCVVSGVFVHRGQRRVGIGVTQVTLRRPTRDAAARGALNCSDIIVLTVGRPPWATHHKQVVKACRLLDATCESRLGPPVDISIATLKVLTPPV